MTALLGFIRSALHYIRVAIQHTPLPHFKLCYTASCMATVTSKTLATDSAETACGDLVRNLNLSVLYVTTNSSERSSSEANSSSSSQDIPRTLWNPKVRYR